MLIVAGSAFALCCASVAPTSAPPTTLATAAPQAAPVRLGTPIARQVDPPAPPSRDCAPIRAEVPELITSTIDVPVPPIVDPNGAMHAFHERMAELIRGQARDHVRIAIFGDSNMTMDRISGEMRRTLQGKYGDGGHGYMALGRPWEWYRHMDVRGGHERLDWTAFAVSTRQSNDRAYGFAGIAARSERPGAVTWVATADGSSPIGTRASRFDVYYLRKPGGGGFDVRVDGSKLVSIATESSALEAGFHAFTLPDAPHKVEFVATSRHTVTLFGVTLEREAPSVIVDSLGIGAVSGPLLLRQHEDIMRAALRRRGYDLIVLLLGSNQVWPVKYESWMAELIARFRDALPKASILVMSPVDQVASSKAPRSVPDVARVARQNERIARDNRCAFWDFRGAMGGEASMARFIGTGMGAADGIHLTQKGTRYMGRRVTHALLRDVDGYLEAHPKAGCSGE